MAFNFLVFNRINVPYIRVLDLTEVEIWKLFHTLPQIASNIT